MHDHLISTVATEHTCPCGTPVLTAVDSGMPARVDATPLVDRAAELAALLDGRWTYTHIRCGWLVHRDSHEITANVLDGPVHRQHRCRPRPLQTTIYDQIGAPK